MSTQYTTVEAQLEGLDPEAVNHPRSPEVLDRARQITEALGLKSNARRFIHLIASLLEHEDDQGVYLSYDCLAEHLDCTKQSITHLLHGRSRKVTLKDGSVSSYRTTGLVASGLVTVIDRGTFAGGSIRPRGFSLSELFKAHATTSDDPASDAIATEDADSPELLVASGGCMDIGYNYPYEASSLDNDIDIKGLKNRGSVQPPYEMQDRKKDEMTPEPKNREELLALSFSARQAFLETSAVPKIRAASPGFVLGTDPAAWQYAMSVAFPEAPSVPRPETPSRSYRGSGVSMPPAPQPEVTDPDRDHQELQAAVAYRKAQEPQPSPSPRKRPRRTPQEPQEPASNWLPEPTKDIAPVWVLDELAARRRSRAQRQRTSRPLQRRSASA